MLALEVVVGELGIVTAKKKKFLLGGFDGAFGHGVYASAYNFRLSFDDAIAGKAFIDHIS